MVNKQFPTKLVWMDLEMTGLDPDRDRITEVAVIITDFNFNELATYEATIKQPQKVLNRMKKADFYDFSSGQRVRIGSVYDVSEQNGLLQRIKTEGKDEVLVEQELIGLIKDHFSDLAILAGNSIHNDRRFIIKWWPDLEKYLHYRMLDVTAYKIWFQGYYNQEYRKSAKNEHRALNDIRGSMAELKYYLAKLGKAKIK